MSDTDGYSGWKNYPTWAVNLWLSNDETLYHAAQEIASSYAADPEYAGNRNYRLACVDESQWGHTFWLSRNSHGAGFFDWSHPEELGAACRRLQDAARVYSAVELYAHEGKVYA